MKCENDQLSVKNKTTKPIPKPALTVKVLKAQIKVF